MTFEDSCRKLGIEPVKVEFNVSPDVYSSLCELADNNDCSLDVFMRDMVDYFLLRCCPE